METPPPIPDSPPPPPEPSYTAAPSSEECTMGMLCHLAAFTGLVVPVPFLGNVIGPLIVWLIKKDTMPFVDDQGKESLNFNISIGIYLFVASIMIFVVIGVFLLVAIGLFWLVMTIVAAVKASSGEAYRYPLCIRLIN